MVQIVAHDEVKDGRTQRDLPGGHHSWRTDFMAAPPERPELPQAFLAQSDAHRVLRTHFHDVDQFQIIVEGDGTLAKHSLAPCGVHFARAHTPYGPIINGDKGLGFLTLRARRDTGGRAQFIPECLATLKGISDRKPWQVTEKPQFAQPAGGGVAMHVLPGVQDEDGLAGYTLTLKPYASTQAVDPSTSDGQYVVVVKGSLIHDGKTYKAITIAFIKPNEGPFELVAGAEGLEALVLNFPRGGAQGKPITGRGLTGDHKTWFCAICGFVYDEAAGMPEEGIAAGTRWADVPETWGCPDCSATKADFEMMEVTA